MSNEIFGKPNQGINWKFGGEVKRSPYKVGVVICFNENEKTYKNFEFIVDRNRFGLTMDFCQKKSNSSAHQMYQIHKATIECSRIENVPFEYMCTIILNFICCFPKLKVAFDNMHDQSLGFVVDIDAKDFQKIGFYSMKLNELDKELKNVHWGVGVSKN